MWLREGGNPLHGETMEALRERTETGKMVGNKEVTCTNCRRWSGKLKKLPQHLNNCLPEGTIIPAELAELKPFFRS